MNANFMLPNDSMLSIEIVEEKILQHRISIRVQKCGKERYLIKDCLYKDDFIELNSYQSEFSYTFSIKCCNYHNEVTFKVRFSYNSGEATLQNWSGDLECDRQIEIQL